jgi:hypothetical protein
LNCKIRFSILDLEKGANSRFLAKSPTINFYSLIADRKWISYAVPSRFMNVKPKNQKEKIGDRYFIFDIGKNFRYRRYVYEAGALGKSEKMVAPVPSSGATGQAPVPSSGATGQAGVIDSKILEKERENDFELDRVRRFRYDRIQW